jgi:hypothetical protein
LPSVANRAANQLRARDRPSDEAASITAKPHVAPSTTSSTSHTTRREARGWIDLFGSSSISILLASEPEDSDMETPWKIGIRQSLRRRAAPDALTHSNNDSA